MATTEELLLELIKQKNLLAAKLASEGIDVEHDETFNALVEKINALYAAEKHYDPNSDKAQSGKAVAEAISGINVPDIEDLYVDQKYDSQSKNAQSGIAVAEGINESVGDINGALSSLTEPGEVDPENWMDQTVNAAVEEINRRTENTISTKIKAALSDLSTQNSTEIKKQITAAIADLDSKTRKAFLLNVHRVTDGFIPFEENMIYAIAKAPTENLLTVYDTETFEPVTFSDRHYCIFVGQNVGDTVCATVLSYPTLDPQIYVVKKGDLQGNISWTGTAIVSAVADSSIE